MRSPATITPATATTKTITYAALGDSLTAGVGANVETESYPYRLGEILAREADTQVSVVSWGQPGATAIDVLKEQVPPTVKLRPDVVTLAIGINDMHNRIAGPVFQTTLVAIVDELSKVIKHINVITIPYLGNNKTFLPPYRYYFDWQTRRFNQLLKTALAGKPVTIIDLYSLTRERAFNDADYYSADGFHPSATAYNFWSTTIYDHLDY